MSGLFDLFFPKEASGNLAGLFREREREGNTMSVTGVKPVKPCLYWPSSVIKQVMLTERIKLTLNGFQLKHKQGKKFTQMSAINSMAHVISEEDTTTKSERLMTKLSTTARTLVFFFLTAYHVQNMTILF